MPFHDRAPSTALLGQKNASFPRPSNDMLLLLLLLREAPQLVYLPDREARRLRFVANAQSSPRNARPQKHVVNSLYSSS